MVFCVQQGGQEEGGGCHVRGAIATRLCGPESQSAGTAHQT